MCHMVSYLLSQSVEEKLLIFQNNVAKDDMGHRKEKKEDFIWNIAHVRKPILNPLSRILMLRFFFDNIKVSTTDLN